MLEVLNLECVRGERRLFAGLEFRMDSGEALHVQGRNGSGKTSLLRILCGLSTPAAGEVRWRGRHIARAPVEFRESLCYLGHKNAIKEELTPLENLLVSTRLAEEAMEGEGAQEALSALAAVGLSGYEDLPCKYLSQGQKRRVALARLVHERRALWVLDEPFVALDTAAVEWLSGLIGAHLGRGGLTVLTTHQEVRIPGAAMRALQLS
ncbi:MAG: cytochrome c biogenesis heme-transporting ATPase CcmA [Betaproteobacteria bacterium]|nr:cytochrome c biogenesis heme-transporting ATPase CcmA [Betaproteobacteria bacterium]